MLNVANWIERVLVRWLNAVAPGEWSDTVIGDVREDARGRTGMSRRAWTIGQLVLIAMRLTVESLVAAWRRARLLATGAADVRYACRVLRRAPLFSAVAIGTLALAIGANTAIYGALRSLVLDPLPFKDGNRFVLVWHTSPAMVGMEITPPESAAGRWRQATHVFDAVETYATKHYVLTDGGEPQDMPASLVHPSLFATVGVTPILGRAILESDTAADAPPVVLISHALWINRFGGDRAVVGRTIALSGVAYRVIGVMPRRFQLPLGSDSLWTAAPRDAHGEDGVTTLAKLRGGMSVDAAQRALGAMPPAADPELKGFTAALMAPGDHNGAQVKSALYVLSGAVGLLLLIACVNVANLFFSRHSGREREMAVRSALGASGGRLARQLFVESAVVAVLGGGAGLVVAQACIAIMAALRPTNLAALERIYLDGPTIVFAAAASVLTALLVGVAPAITASRVRLLAILGAGSRSVTSAGLRLRTVLTTAQVAIALVLLVAGALLLRSYANLTAVNPGFDPTGVLSVRMSLPADRYPSKDKLRRAMFFDDVLRAAQALPGVTSAAIGTGVPPDSSIMFGAFVVEGAAAPKPAPTEIFSGGYVSPGYFRTLGIPVLSGRAFTDDDAAGRDPVVIVSKSLADARWPGRSPLGARITFPAITGTATVVGVVGDVKALSLTSDGIRQLYFPRAQTMPGYGALVVRASGDPRALVPAIKSRIWALDKQLPLSDIATAEQLMQRSASQGRFNMALLVAFAGCGLTLAVVGVYGVMALWVGRRRQELGIRMALGASRGTIVAMMLRHALVIVGAGVAVGGVGAALLSRYMTSLLFGVEPRDVASFAGGAAALTLTALAAMLIPIRRAAAEDPTSALRAD